MKAMNVGYCIDSIHRHVHKFMLTHSTKRSVVDLSCNYLLSHATLLEVVETIMTIINIHFPIYLLFFQKISFISIKKSIEKATKCTIRECYIQKRWSGQGPGVMIIPDRSFRGDRNFPFTLINWFFHKSILWEKESRLGMYCVSWIQYMHPTTFKSSYSTRIEIMIWELVVCRKRCTNRGKTRIEASGWHVLHANWILAYVVINICVHTYIHIYRCVCV